MNTPNPGFYTVGGPVQAGSGVYVPRKADGELLALCKEGTFAYVLTARQMGKSSLMVRTARRLADDGIVSVIIDLQESGKLVSGEQWYLNLVVSLKEALDEQDIALGTNVRQWWQKNKDLDLSKRLSLFMEQVLLAEVNTSIVIFVDEIDTILGIDFTDDFLVAIRYFAVSRAVKPIFRRLSFVLIGGVTPEGLIRARQQTPFNVGQRVDLTDFTLAEAWPLAAGLGLPQLKAEKVMAWVMGWTGGHPYLTQQLCRALAERSKGESQKHTWSKRIVDDVVATTFFGLMAERDNNLQFVRGMLTKSEHEIYDVLTMYRDVLAGRQPVVDDEQSLIKSHLKLSGVVKRNSNKILGVRNGIYERVFDVAWVRDNLSMNVPNPSFYTVGGPVQAGSGVYVIREADDELLALCKEGTFAYVLTARQTGKSSLMVRTAEQLTNNGIVSVIVDLQGLGKLATVDQWYLDFLVSLEEALDEQDIELNTQIRKWWQENQDLGPSKRFSLFIEQVLLAEVTAPVVIFVDEIDTTLGIDFTDDFFVVIRYFAVSRAVKPIFKRLSFVLIGVATPGDLIQDRRRTPFNVGQRVDLTDFTLKEAWPLAKGLGLPQLEAEKIMEWVIEWTGGHPYLTQQLCRTFAERSREEGQKQVWVKRDVDDMVASTFLGLMAERDNNLQFVRGMLTNNNYEAYEVLTTYRNIWVGRQPVMDDEQSLTKSHLKLSGVVKRETNKTLRVRNKIYERVFDETWVSNNLPINWKKRIRRLQTITLTLALLSLGTISLLLEVQRRNLRQRCLVWYESYLGANEDVIEKFSNKEDPDRIKCENIGIYF